MTSRDALTRSPNLRIKQRCAGTVLAFNASPRVLRHAQLLEFLALQVA